MRGAVFREPGGPLHIESMPDPSPANDQVVIAVKKCGICSSDVLMTAAGSPMSYEVGARLGHEYAGEVVDIGRDVTDFAVGDRVTALPMTSCGDCAACRLGDPFGCAGVGPVMGGYSEYTVARTSYVTRLPDVLTFSDGALVEPLACGSQAVRLGRVDRRSKVLVVGVGPVGLSSIYWSARLGARTAAAARTDTNAGTAATMGAADFVPVGPDFTQRLQDAMEGLPDVIIDCTGSAGVIASAFDSISGRGTVVTSALCFAEERFVPGQAMLKQATLTFSLGYRVDDFARSVAAMAAGHLQPRAMVGPSIGLDELPDALQSMRAFRASSKLMVEPWR